MTIAKMIWRVITANKDKRRGMALLLESRDNGWAVVTSDRVNTTAMAEMNPEELVDSALHLTDMGETMLEQEAAVNSTMQIANGHG